MRLSSAPTPVAAEPATLRSPGSWRRTPQERCGRFGCWQCRCVRATRAAVVRASCLAQATRVSDQLLKPIMAGQDLARSIERAALAGPPLTQRRRPQHGLSARRDRALVSYAAGARWPVSQGSDCSPVDNSVSNGSVSNPRFLRKAGYVTTVIAIVPAVRFPVPVDVAAGVAVTVAVPGAMPRTSPAAETVKTFVFDDSKVTSLICDGSSGFDVPSENIRVTASWITSPTRTVAGPVTWAVTSRLYSPQAVRLANATATTSVPVHLGGVFGVREPVRMLHLPTNGRARGCDSN